MREERRQSKRICSVRELDVYKLAFEAAMEIFELTKSFPKEETYSMVDQMRRSSRSVLHTMEIKADSFCNVK